MSQSKSQVREIAPAVSPVVTIDGCGYGNPPQRKQVSVRMLHSGCVLPTYATTGSAGLDVYSTIDIIIGSGGRVSIPLGFCMAVPPGHFVRIESRSGLAFNHGVQSFNGVIDSDYRGEIYISLVNFGGTEFKVTRGMKISQMIMYDSIIMDLNTLSSGGWNSMLAGEVSTRGDGGFGSTGL